VDFEDVGPLGKSDLSNLDHPPEEMIGRVIGERRAAKGDHARASAEACCGIRTPRVKELLFVARPGSEHHLLVTELAQNMTFGR
jgi:hypothetical protein